MESKVSGWENERARALEREREWKKQIEPTISVFGLVCIAKSYCVWSSECRRQMSESHNQIISYAYMPRYIEKHLHSTQMHQQHKNQYIFNLFSIVSSDFANKRSVDKSSQWESILRSHNCTAHHRRWIESTRYCVLGDRITNGIVLEVQQR